MQHPLGMQRAEGALLLTALSCPVIIWCTGLAWQWVFLGGAGAFLVFLLVSRQLRGGSTLQELTQMSFGRVFGGILLALQAIWLLVPAFFLLRAVRDVFPGQTELPLYPVILAALALAAVWKRDERPAAVGGILFYFVVIMLAIVLLLPTADLKAEWLYTPAPMEQAMPAAAILLLPMTALYAGAKGGRRLWPWVLTGCLFAGAAALVTYGYLSPQVASGTPMAFMTMTRSLHLFGIMERFEAVLSAVLTIGCFCCLMQLLRCVQAAVPAAPKAAASVFVAASLALSFFALEIPEIYTIYGAAIFWGLIPLCTVLVAAVKKGGKRKK